MATLQLPVEEIEILKETANTLSDDKLMSFCSATPNTAKFCEESENISNRTRNITYSKSKTPEQKSVLEDELENGLLSLDKEDLTNIAKSLPDNELDAFASLPKGKTVVFSDRYLADRVTKIRSASLESPKSSSRSPSSTRASPRSRSPSPTRSERLADRSERLASRSERLADRSERLADSASARSERLADRSERLADRSERLSNRSERVASRSASPTSPRMSLSDRLTTRTPTLAGSALASRSARKSPGVLVPGSLNPEDYKYVGDLEQDARTLAAMPVALRTTVILEDPESAEIAESIEYDRAVAELRASKSKSLSAVRSRSPSPVRDSRSPSKAVSFARSPSPSRKSDDSKVSGAFVACAWSGSPSKKYSHADHDGDTTHQSWKDRNLSRSPSKSVEY